MEINKKNRKELKSYFLANNIPTQKNFEDLVEAQLNQAEDGIAKVEGSPISLEAEGDPGGSQDVLHLYADFADPNPAWGFNLNPRVDSNAPESNQPGLNIKDATGASRLFIRSAGGEIGLGTIEPSAKLTIQATEDASLLSVTSGNAGNTRIFEVSQEQNDAQVSLRNGEGDLVSRVSGSQTKDSFFLNKVGVGTDQPEALLHIEGPGAELLISNSVRNQPPKVRFQHLNGRSWQMKSRGSALDFIPSDNDNNKLVMTESGGLQIRGSGRTGIPNGAMHISEGVILFGGNNTSGRQHDSAQISAGMHRSNSLNIVGMASGSGHEDRQVDIWAEGGMTVRGHIKIPSTYVVHFAVSLKVHTSGNRNPLVFGHTTRNIGNHWHGNSVFHAPVKGIYLFCMSMRNNSDSDVLWRLRLNLTGFVNGAGTSTTENGERTFVRSRLDNHTASRTVITLLNKGDRVHVEQIGGRNDNYTSGFEGILLTAVE